MQKDHKLEICAADIASVKAAADGGADRIELCAALSEGGLTPSEGFIRKALEEKRLKVNVLIRPRSGNFVYSPAEKEIILSDIALCRRLGANGVVIGALLPDGSLDTDFCREMLASAGEMETTFHRAFDVCSSPDKTLEQLIELGFTRILTSGQESSAMQGAANIRRIAGLADGRILIMAGAGVNPGNIADLKSESQADDFHASARTAMKTESTNKVSMGASDGPDSVYYTTNPETVKALADIVKS